LIFDSHSFELVGFKFLSGTGRLLAANDQGLAQVWNQNCACPQPLLIENILMKLKIKVECCWSSPNK
jgi:hypothetical protein